MNSTKAHNPLRPLGFILTIILGLFCSVIGLWSSCLYASPSPAAGSSLLVAPERGLFFSSKGFTVSAPSEWQLEKSLDEKESTNSSANSMDEMSSEFSVKYTNTQFPTARLSVKTDTLRNDISIEAYAKKWMKDYSSYGFDVLGAKTFLINKTKGLVVDLVHKKQGTQLRQVIFLRKKTAVTLTCLDQPKMFNASLAGCNQIIKTFSWNSIQENPSSQKSF